MHFCNCLSHVLVPSPPVLITLMGCICPLSHCPLLWTYSTLCSPCLWHFTVSYCVVYQFLVHSAKGFICVSCSEILSVADFCISVLIVFFILWCSCFFARTFLKCCEKAFLQALVLTWFSLRYLNIVLIEPYGLQLLPLLELIFKRVPVNLEISHLASLMFLKQQERI